MKTSFLVRFLPSPGLSLLVFCALVTPLFASSSHQRLDRQLENLIKKLQREVITDEEFAAQLKAVLAETPKSEAVPQLIQLLENQRKDPDARGLAAQVLGEIGDAGAADPLVRAAADAEWWVRARAIEALGMLKHERAPDLAMAALTDKEAIVRQFAADVLGDLRASGAVPNLVELLADSDVLVRSRVEKALVNIGSPSVDPLLAALGHRAWAGREDAIEALGELKDPKAVASLIAVFAEDSTLRFDVRRALVEIGEPAIDPLLAQLNSPQKEVREQVADALGGLKNVRAVGPMLKSIPDKSDIAYIAYPISHMGASAVRPTLEGIRSNHIPGMCAAVMALGLLGDKRTTGVVTAFVRYEKAKRIVGSWTCRGSVAENALRSLGVDPETVDLPGRLRPRIPDECSPEEPAPAPNPAAEPAQPAGTVLEQSEELHKKVDEKFQRFKMAMECTRAKLEGADRAEKELEAAVDAALATIQ